jgi:hypothetical protein
MVVEYIPAFSTVNESGQVWGSVSVGPGITEAFVVGTGVGGVVGSGVVGAGVGVTTGWGGGEEQPATTRSTASNRVRKIIDRNFMMGFLSEEYLRIPMFLP